MRALLLAALLISSCSVDYTGRMAPVRSALTSGEDALPLFGEAFQDSTGGDRLLFLMEKGNLLRLRGRYADARRLLLEADRLSDMQRGTDLGEEAASLLTSDLAREFRGADYEQVLLNYCLAACYASEGELEEALVECRRVNEKLEAFNTGYEHDNRYRDDAFVRYMMGVLFEAAGDMDDALVAYRNALRVYETDYGSYYGFQVPERLEIDILRVSALPGFEDLHSEFSNRWPGVSWEGTGAGEGRGEVVAFVEEGLIPPRYERSVEGYSENRVYRVAVPAIVAPGRRTSTVILECGDARSEGFLAEDLAAVAEKNLEDSAARDLARAIARAAAKAGAAGLAEEAVEEATGDESGCWSEGTGLAVSVIGAAMENADLRAWLTLPARISVARLSLEPGPHRVGILVDGRRISEQTIEIEEGVVSLLFVSAPGGK